METTAPQTIAPAMQMPSQGSSTTVFKTSPAHNKFSNGTTKAPASVEPMEVQCDADTNHNQPTTSNAASKTPVKAVNNEKSSKPSPTQSQSRPRPKRHQHKPEVAVDTKVEVSGYPAYVKPQDLYKVFASYGAARVEHVGRRFAVVTFETREAARAALADSMQLCLYSHFLAVKPFSGQIDDQKRQVYKSKHTVVTVPPASIALEGSFGEQLAALLAAVRLTQEQVTALAALYADLERVMQPVWPGCQAMPFGSITTGLGVKSSDADCFMNIPPQFRYGSNNFVMKAKKILQKYPELFAEVFAIPRANTPIVKLFHRPTGTHCDLTFKTPLGALNSKLVAFLLHADPRLLPLAVAVKYWAGAHALSGSGRLTNYALTLLLVFYLQQRRLLPPVATLQRAAPPVLVDHWNTGFLEDRALLPRPADPAPVQLLLGGFFQFYAAFDFDTQVVCPYLGRPVPKAQFQDGGLPDEFARYERNVADNLVAPLRTRLPLCVQDPFEQCHNVASAVTARMAEDLRAYMRFAADHYEKDEPNDCRNFLRAILLEKPKPVRPRNTPEYRIALPTKMLNAIVRPEWREALRAAVFTVFERMLKLKLAPVGKPEPVRKGRERELYASSMSRPLWRRRQHGQHARLDGALGLIERQARITEEILRVERCEWLVEFQLALTFSSEVRNAWVSMRLTAGDADAFCCFGKYLLATLQHWLVGVLRAAGDLPEDDGTGSARPREPQAALTAALQVTSEATPEKAPEETPEKALKETPEKAPKETPEKDPEETPEEVPEENPEKVPEEQTSPPGEEAIRPDVPPDC